MSSNYYEEKAKKKKIIVHFRVTEKEYEKMCKYASEKGVTISDYIRDNINKS